MMTMMIDDDNGDDDDDNDDDNNGDNGDEDNDDDDNDDDDNDDDDDDDNDDDNSDDDDDDDNDDENDDNDDEHHDDHDNDDGDNVKWWLQFKLLKHQSLSSTIYKRYLGGWWFSPQKGRIVRRKSVLVVLSEVGSWMSHATNKDDGRHHFDQILQIGKLSISEHSLG